MARPVRKLPTWDDLHALGEDAPAEIVAGEIVVPAAPRLAHGAMAFNIGGELYGPFGRGRGGPGGWWFASEVDLLLPDGQIYRPDLVGWRREHVPELPSERPATARPDWVCEVLSPPNAAFDWGPKRDGYHAWGVPHYWLADPEARMVTVLSWSEAGYLVARVARDGEKARLAPFEAVEIAIADLLP